MSPLRLDVPDDPSDYAVSDEAAAFIADALMQLALQFESTHFAQIRRHNQSIAPERDDEHEYDLFGNSRVSDENGLK
jgi:hypothetical protein